MNPRDLCKNYIPNGKQDSGTKEWSILQLGTSDLFSLGFTLWKNFSSPSFPSLNVVACDYIPRVIARHLLLLHVLLSHSTSTLPTDSIFLLWEITFNFAISPETLSTIKTTARELCDCAGVNEKGEGGDFVGEQWKDRLFGRAGVSVIGETEELGKVLRRWERGEEEPLEELLGRVDVFLGKRGIKREDIEDRNWGSFSHLVFTRKIEGFKWGDYWQKGFVSPPSSPATNRTRVNLTFCFPDEMFLFHYQSHPFLAFHKELLLTSLPGPFLISSLLGGCFSQFSSFMLSLWRGFGGGKYDRCAQICFYLGDALRCCDTLQSPPRSWFNFTKHITLKEAEQLALVNAPISFHMIDSSNLADHLGAIPLLVSGSCLLSRKIDEENTSGVLPSLLVVGLMNGKMGDHLSAVSEAVLHVPLSLLPLLFGVALDDHRVSVVEQSETNEGTVKYRKAIVRTGGEGEGLEKRFAKYDKEGHWICSPRTAGDQLGSPLFGRRGISLCFRAIFEGFDVGFLRDSPQMVEELGNLRRECLRMMRRIPMGVCTWVRVLIELGVRGVVDLEEDLGLVSGSEALTKDSHIVHFGKGTWKAEVESELLRGSPLGEMEEVVCPLPSSFFDSLEDNTRKGCNSFKVILRVKSRTGPSYFPASIISLGPRTEKKVFIARVPNRFLCKGSLFPSFHFDLLVETHLQSTFVALFSIHREKFCVSSVPKWSSCGVQRMRDDFPPFRFGEVTKVEWNATFTRIFFTLSTLGHAFLGDRAIRLVHGVKGWEDCRSTEKEEGSPKKHQRSCCIGVEVVGKGFLASFYFPIMVCFKSIKVRVSRKLGWLEISVPFEHYVPLMEKETVGAIYPRVVLGCCCEGRNCRCGRRFGGYVSPVLSSYWMRAISLASPLRLWLLTMCAEWERGDQLQKGGFGDFRESLLLIFESVWKERIRGIKKEIRCSRICLKFRNSPKVLLVVPPRILYDSNSLFALPVGVYESRGDEPFPIDMITDCWIIVNSKEEQNIWKEYLPLCYSLAGRENPQTPISSWVHFPTGLKEGFFFFRSALFVPLFSSYGGIPSLSPETSDPSRMETDFAGVQENEEQRKLREMEFFVRFMATAMG